MTDCSLVRYATGALSALVCASPLAWVALWNSGSFDFSSCFSVTPAPAICSSSPLLSAWRDTSPSDLGLGAAAAAPTSGGGGPASVGGIGVTGFGWPAFGSGPSVVA